MNSDKVTLSLVLPTVGRIKDLERLFDSLKAQTDQRFEIIVADQSSTPAVVEEFIQRYTQIFIIRHVLLTSHGAARARNEGSKFAVGELIGWPDDDCWYEPDCVEKVIQFFCANGSASAVIGYPLNESGAPYNRWVPGYTRKASILDALNHGIEWVVFFKQASLNHIGFFDGNFGAGAGTKWGAGESADLCMRAILAGEGILCSPDIKVHHPQSGRQSEADEKKAVCYAYGMGATVRKNYPGAWNVCRYLWTYLRAALWSLLCLRLADFRYHLKRLIGVIMGYRNYYRDRKMIR